MKIVWPEVRGMSHPIPLDSIVFPVPPRILVMAPHPDDFDAAGVTMKFFHKLGSEISLSVVRTGGGVEESYCSPPTLENMARIREAEQRRSCAFFGLPAERLVFIDPEPGEAELLDTPGNLEKLAAVFNACRPDLVFLPHRNDTNIGHLSVYSMFRKLAVQATFPLIAFLVIDPKTISARTDLYLPFDQQQADWKGELLRFHDTQHQRNLNTRGHGIDDRILNVNRQNAIKLGLDLACAEAFELEFYDATEGAN
ncbi:MAG: PIG-L family deacetylase [Kiritimatiellales bacterium]|nr:PIG-L family deacetylase [Kiritimatiellales bacterium]